MRAAERQSKRETGKGRGDEKEEQAAEGGRPGEYQKRAD